jgi:N-acetylmuramoyl-L-alanine amidase
MPEHKVKQGEHISSIAQKYGFADFHKIWDDPQNDELKKNRENPHILKPSDILFIPEREAKEESCASGQRHRFRFDAPTLKLRLKIKDFDGKPLKNSACRLTIHNIVHELETNDDGLIEVPIANNAEHGLLQFEDPTLPFDVNIPIKIGYLNPINTVTGQKARLKNLGYYAGPLTDEQTTEFQYAVEEFQCDYDLTVDGVCGDQTQAKLKEEHGC